MHSHHSYLKPRDDAPTYDMRLPEARAHNLIAHCFAHEPRPAWELAHRDFPWWWAYVRTRFGLYCLEHGEHRLPGAGLLKVARHLKFYYDQKAKDDATYVAFNTREIPLTPAPTIRPETQAEHH